MIDETLELSCKQAARLMSVRRDRSLEPSEEETLRAHLYECLNCQAFDRQLDLLSALARRYAASGATVEPDPTD